MKERRKDQRRSVQRRVDIEGAKRHLGMERRLVDRRAGERRAEED